MPKWTYRDYPTKEQTDLPLNKCKLADYKVMDYIMKYAPMMIEETNKDGNEVGASIYERKGKLVLGKTCKGDSECVQVENDSEGLVAQVHTHPKGGVNPTVADVRAHAVQRMKNPNYQVDCVAGKDKVLCYKMDKEFLADYQNVLEQSDKEFEENGKTPEYGYLDGKLKLDYSEEQYETLQDMFDFEWSEMEPHPDVKMLARQIAYHYAHIKNLAQCVRVYHAP